jgi:hypothetical protein
MIIPTIAAKTEVINTAAAATSFAAPIYSFCSFVTASQRYSIAVLKTSAEITIETDRTRRHHWIADILSHIAPRKTMEAASRCIQKLGWVLRTRAIP